MIRKILALLFVILLPSVSLGTTFHVTTSTFASTFSSATTGDILLLAPGNYGSFSGANKPGTVTIQSDSGAGGTQANVIFGALSFSTSVQNITMVNMTIAGGDISAKHIRLTNIHYTDALCLRTPSDANFDVILDGGDFTNIGESCTEGRLGVTGSNISHAVVNGIVIKNILFSGSGPSDGIQINGSAYGTVIGPGNEFSGIKESGCGAVHCDPIQFYGAVNTTVTGNYFHGNSTGLADFDGFGSPMTVTNNVFVTDGEYPWQISIGGGDSDIVDHNTMANGAIIRVSQINASGFSVNETLTNNIVTGGYQFDGGQTTGTFTLDYNLIPGGGSGAHTINGSPTYVGGSLPSTFAGFRLTSGSAGHNAASNGQDMGAAITGGVVITNSASGNVVVTGAVVLK